MKTARKGMCCAAVAVALALAGCGKEKEKETEPVVPVQVTEVRTDSIQRVVRAGGVLRALDQSAVMPKISAPVSRFYVNRGDHVRQGQLLATLENRDLAASVADTKGAFDQAASNFRNVSAATVPDELVKARADLQSAKQQMDAARKLLDSREQIFKEGALARRQVDEAAVALAQARGAYETAQKHMESLEGVSRHEEVKSAQAQMESAKGKYDAAQAQLSYSEVRAPISGVIADRPLFAGEMANPGAALLTIVDVSSVIARINLPPAEAAALRTGMAAKIKASDSETETSGRVTVVSPAVDPQSTTVEVWVQAPNPGERLRPGGAVQVEITAGTISGATVVPPEALLPADEGGTALMVVDAGVAHQHKVEVGVRAPDKVQIESGAKAGEQVVIAGGVGLSDGAKVKVVKPGEKQEEKKDKDDDKKDEKK